uniref:NADH-ubiquinone oxidoreductase chain 6 n=6 Tax=Sophophora TaxID=32341 RepID=NU6M_DROME|nr:NADH dehydrogenase subunit 6 [Drosophila melanogaster]P18933.1 RecName: Full=NADH-ubiquinone oxidoreductase chain 6; AltName: Full=NADH dehydrogenase subunit 6 [Drosophila melanogaster]8ESW_6 Chain 6, NADH-ubiquinone oxidoreductase chain 6 [Drosophila melanogaster]8ESZ_6 Chain 6, NADH-ubiquinone oxidoreductase chain 6 [Drosophila melanogaster]AAA69713.1 unknown [Drosophila melanogaster]AAC47821.1 NADH dehydrogenase subunit 6 [Drosophila melanogaster]AAF77236.1 NADH dehydrogenase subunit 6 |eukprot:YP_009047276.1 NADH dehydrogenase subunit 6 (mitochondrion) [Drosophila melanogaster]
MIQLMLYSLIITTSIIFLNMIHPLALGLTLLIQTIFVCLLTGLMTKSFWYSYILFLIFLGGMLVLFIYVTSLASNEMFNLSMKLTLFSSLILIFMLILSFIMDKTSSSLFLMNNDMQSIINMNSYFMENSLSLNKLYNFPTNFITILLMNYLLITLIVIVKITKLFKGPIRMMS